MGSQNKKMGRILKLLISIVCQSIFIIIVTVIFTQYAIFAMEPNSVIGRSSITPTEAWLEFGKYFTMSMGVIISIFGVLKFVLDNKLRIEVMSKITQMETNYTNLEKSFKDLACKINELYTLHLKK